jgi:hypothetical protein
MKPGAWHLVLAVVVSTAGCDMPDTRGCPLVAHSSSNSYLLDYELLIPSHCPVPLGTIGEWKRAGARVFDYGNRDFLYAEARVADSELITRGSQVVRFSDYGEYSLAQPTTVYQAAVAGGFAQIQNRYDYGWFYATNSAMGGFSGDPFGQIRITYTPTAMTNLIAGSSIPPRSATATWQASVSGGVPPYSFYWYRDSALVGTSQYYSGLTGNTNFDLRSIVVDQTMSERTAVMLVDVGGALVAIDGPSEATMKMWDPFSSMETWTAVISGGTAPFSYTWFRDGLQTGSNTSSHTEIIDERVDFRLRVVIQDATGKSAITDKDIRVIQRDCPSCPSY